MNNNMKKNSDRVHLREIKLPLDLAVNLLRLKWHLSTGCTLFISLLVGTQQISQKCNSDKIWCYDFECPWIRPRIHDWHKSNFSFGDPDRRSKTYTQLLTVILILEVIGFSDFDLSIMNDDHFDDHSSVSFPVYIKAYWTGHWNVRLYGWTKATYMLKQHNN